MELGIPYELVGPDGTRIVFGNSDAAKADADYVGWLDPDNGIAGLDSPELRDNTTLIAAGHGGIAYDALHGRRPLVANIVLDPTVMDALGVDPLERKVKRAHNAMTADSVLEWTNTGQPRKRLLLRKNGATRITGRRPKSATLELLDVDYRMHSADVHDTGAKARNAAAVVNNAGDELASWRLEITGPFNSTVRARNLTTGLEVRLKPTFSVAAGQVLVIEASPPWPVVELNGAPAYSAVDFLPSSWWGLVPGANNIEVDGGSGAGTWRLYSRDAWV